MKKHSLAVVALLFLFANTIYAQKINCAWCKNGDGYNLRRDWIVCLNCKNWAKSYRDKVPCTVCKDNRGHYSAYYKVTCSDCKGSGRNYAAEKQAKWDSSVEGVKDKEQRRSDFSAGVLESAKKSFCEENLPWYIDQDNGEFVPSRSQILRDLVNDRNGDGTIDDKDSYHFETKIGTWKMENKEVVEWTRSPFYKKKNCTLEIDIDVILEDSKTNKRYNCVAVLTYGPDKYAKRWEYSGFILNSSTMTLRY